MANESCIHPSCNCRAYRDPGHQKGWVALINAQHMTSSVMHAYWAMYCAYIIYRTLLLFRLGCKQCGHPGSEHRKLTAVDTLVQDEVEKAAGTRCTHLIPHSEIPHSPAFRPHDPIPIPYDTSEHDQVHVYTLYMYLHVHVLKIPVEDIIHQIVIMQQMAPTVIHWLSHPYIYKSLQEMLAKATMGRQSNSSKAVIFPRIGCLGWDSNHMYIHVYM